MSEDELHQSCTTSSRGEWRGRRKGMFSLPPLSDIKKANKVSVISSKPRLFNSNRQSRPTVGVPLSPPSSEQSAHVSTKGGPECSDVASGELCGSVVRRQKRVRDEMETEGDRPQKRGSNERVLPHSGDTSHKPSTIEATIANSSSTTSGTSQVMNHLQASSDNTLPSGVGSSGMGSSGMGPSGVGSSGVAPSGMGSSGVGSSGVAPSGMGSSGVGSRGVAPSGMGSSGVAPSGMGSSGVGSSGMGPSGARTVAASEGVPSTTVSTVLPTAHHPHAIIANIVQKKNPVMKHIRNVPWELGDVIPDFVLGKTTCAMFLSIRYHSLHPNYIHSRLKELGKQYQLRILLVLIDMKECQKALQELAKIAILADLTLMLAWSYEEAGRYLETYKAFENKPPDMLMERIDSDFFSRATECLTTVKKVNKTDAATLLNNFKTLDKVITASRDELILCPGLGPQKAQRLFTLFNQPFKTSKQLQE